MLETELGNLLFEHQASSEGLLANPDPERAAEILDQVNRSTLGRLLRTLGDSDAAVPDLETQLQHALDERNRLAHHFFRQHNFRINSEEGRSLMYQDLEDLHEVILKAYKAFLRVTRGVDLDNLDPPPPPTDHVPI